MPAACWGSLPVDVRLLILSRLPLSDALSLHSALPSPASRAHVRARVARLQPLRDAWVRASQPALRSYANSPALRTAAARRLLPPARFSRLATLPLGGVRLASLAGVGELRDVRVLDASRNALATVPNEIARCVNLTTLNLGLNRLVAFPDVVLTLPRLTTLLLHHNTIRTLPAEWGDVKQLCRLGLFNCAIDGDLPEQLCKMLGTQTAARTRRSANLQNNHLDQGLVDSLFRRFPMLASAVVL